VNSIRIQYAVLLLGSCLAAIPASAATIDVLGISAQWQNRNPTFGVTIDNSGSTKTARWGWPSSGGEQSAYEFTPRSGAFTVHTDVNNGMFLIGDFTHVNEPISFFFLNSIDLRVDLNIRNSTPSTYSSVFRILHEETTNTAVPCPASDGGSVPGQPCPDFVKMNGMGSSNTFTVGGQPYALKFIAFSSNSGASFYNVFRSPENASNMVKLYAQMSWVGGPITPMPEPSSLLMMGASGIVLVWLARRRRSARSK
jgi:hypothetical protein